MGIAKDEHNEYLMAPTGTEQDSGDVDCQVMTRSCKEADAVAAGADPSKKFGNGFHVHHEFQMAGHEGSDWLSS